jgi:hypothetical protein
MQSTIAAQCPPTATFVNRDPAAQYFHPQSPADGRPAHRPRTQHRSERECPRSEQRDLRSPDQRRSESRLPLVEQRDTAFDEVRTPQLDRELRPFPLGWVETALTYTDVAGRVCPTARVPNGASDGLSPCHPPVQPVPWSTRRHPATTRRQFYCRVRDIQILVWRRVGGGRRRNPRNWSRVGSVRRKRTQWVRQMTCPPVHCGTGVGRARSDGEGPNRRAR